MLTESWLRPASVHSCFQSSHKRQRESEGKADADQDQESDDSNHQVVRVEDGPEKSEHESGHSCYDPLNLMSLNNVLSDPVVYFECDFDHSSWSCISMEQRRYI